MPYKDRNQKRENNRKWYWLNREKRLVSLKAWNDANKERMNEVKKEWYQNNKEYHKEYSRQYKQQNKEVSREQNKKWKARMTKEQKDKAKATRKRYSLINRDKINARGRETYKNDINSKLARRIRCRLRDALKDGYKSGSAITNLGCSMEELKSYIESLWTEGMSWENYTKDGWHIDHKYLLCSFYLEDPEQFKIACHHTNLQPLWWYENVRKQSREQREKRYYSLQDLAA